MGVRASESRAVRAPDAPIETESEVGRSGGGVADAAPAIAAPVAFRVREIPDSGDTAPAPTTAVGAAAASEHEPRRALRSAYPRFYVPVAAKLAIALVVATVWLGVSGY